jgi:hypothetical protein
MINGIDSEPIVLIAEDVEETSDVASVAVVLIQ